MTIKKGFIGTLLLILLLGLALPVHAEVEIQRSTCEMTINSAKHTFSSPSNATGDCNGLVFGFYNSNQDTFAVTGMIDYDFNASVKEFIVATPAGKHAEAVLTVYTVKEAPKPQPKPEEPKKETKPTPVEKPKEEPKKETPKTESKPSTQKPKEESKTNTSTEKPKATNPKPSTSQKDSVTSNQSNSSEKEKNSASTEVASNTTDEGTSQEVEKEEPEKTKVEDLGENQKIHSILEKDGTEIYREQSEQPKTELASSETKNANESNGLIVYVIIIGIVLLSGFGWWFYKRKVS